MRDWISKILGGSSGGSAEGVPAQWARRLDKWLERVEKLDATQTPAGTADDIRSYLFTGEPVSVLGVVGQSVAVGEALGMIGFFHGREADQFPDLYEHFEALPAPIGLRWAKLLDASVAPQASSYRLKLPSGRSWLEALVIHNSGQGINTWSSRAQAGSLTADAVEALLTEDGQPAATLMQTVFNTPAASAWGVEERLKEIREFKGFAAALDRHLEHIRPLLNPAAAAHRVLVLAMLEKALPATLERIAPELSELATASSKQVRAAAEALVRKCGESVLEPLKELASGGRPEQRQHALRLLMDLGRQRNNGSWQAFARETAAADKAPTVTALIAEWDGLHAPQAPHAAASYTFELPAIDWSAEANPVPDAVLDRLWREIGDAITEANDGLRKRHAQSQAQGHTWPLQLVEHPQESERHELREYLHASTPLPPPQRTNKDGKTQERTCHHALEPIRRAAQDNALTPVATLKLLVFFGLETEHHNDSLSRSLVQTFNAIHASTGRPTLLELSLMLDGIGRKGTELLDSYCTSWGTAIASDWERDAVWPYFAHHAELVVQTLGAATTTNYWFNRAALFRAIATLPSPPPAVVNALYSLALGAGKTDRIAAQDALQNLQGKEARIVGALADGKGEVRAIAATWLARLRHEPSIPALEQAVAKEKQDVAKGAMLDALQALGRPVEKYLDRGSLPAEAKKTLAKGIPKDLEWFPWNAMPPVRWHDTDEPVPTEVLRMFLVQAVKQKSPEPNAVLRKYCAMFEPRDREAFGQFVLETWLHEDVRPIAPDDALKQARSSAQSTHQWMTQSPQWYQNDPNLGKSVEELTAAYLPNYLKQPAGSAIASKGLLAVAAACAAERAAPAAQRYLKEWYGTRAAHGKALIAMLAWIEHPSATQLMLSIGSRFRTKSFQEEATRQAEMLAERKGWTLAELADRTVPSAGFDDTGTMDLSYGNRVFTARLLPDFKVELFNPEGKKITALPDPRQDDDAELAKDAKKAFSASKKELKSIVELQTDRLYEALCTERDWPFADWRSYLQQHPVLRHLVQRLVWVEVEDGLVVRSFRPLDDGTLTDREDNPVELADEARIRVAHDSLLDADEVQAWLGHLADYEVKPLFQQLGKGVYALPEDKKQADEIKDFEGHLLEAYALRGRALKLGYTRGASEDGGWFYVYQKRFPTLGLEAVLQFTGNPLPEENRTVALIGLSFSRSGGQSDSWSRGKVPLAKVPKVLLSECYNDLRLVAAEGSGFDPDWQKKSEY